MSIIIQQIKNESEEILNSFMYTNFNNFTYNTIKNIIYLNLQKYIIKGSIHDFKIICDNSNNTDIRYLNIDIHIFNKYYFSNIIQLTTNKKNLLKELRLKKLKKLNMSYEGL